MSLARGRPWPWLAALALPLAALAASATDPLDALLHELAARRHRHVAFTEVQYLAMLERPLQSSGELLYEAPDRLEKRTLSPRPETLVLEHGTLSATRGRRTRTLELGAWPQLAPLLESLRATLAGDGAALEHVFEVTLEGDASHWTLRLTPREPAAARAIRQVSITGTAADLKTVEILEGDGDRSVLTVGRDLLP